MFKVEPRERLQLEQFFSLQFMTCCFVYGELSAWSFCSIVKDISALSMCFSLPVFLLAIKKINHSQNLTYSSGKCGCCTMVIFYTILYLL